MAGTALELPKYKQRKKDLRLRKGLLASLMRRNRVRTPMALLKRADGQPQTPKEIKRRRRLIEACCIVAKEYGHEVKPA